MAIFTDSYTGVFQWILRNFQEHLFWKASANGCSWWQKYSLWEYLKAINLPLNLEIQSYYLVTMNRFYQTKYFSWSNEIHTKYWTHQKNILLSLYPEAATNVFCKRRCFQKFCKFPRTTPVLESVFNKVAVLQACNIIKNRLQQRCFVWIFQEHLFWGTPANDCLCFFSQTDDSKHKH